MTNKILITGGAGFIGLNLAGILSRDKQSDVHIVDDLSKGELDREFEEVNKNENVSFQELDLADPASYSRIDRDFNQIYHHAAIVGVRRVMENPVLTMRANMLSTIFLLDHIRDMDTSPKVVFASSCENYAGSIKHCQVPIPTPEDVPLCIEDVFNPRWAYASSKTAGEIACLQYAKTYGFDTSVVRYHNVYGPRMGYSHVIPEFVERLLKRPKVFEMFGGDQYRTFCYVTDATQMTINIMNSNQANARVVNIGDDTNHILISEIAEKLCDLIDFHPEFAERGAPNGSVSKRMPDLKLIKELKAYVSQVSFDAGLALTFEWYKDRLSAI